MARIAVFLIGKMTLNNFFFFFFQPLLIPKRKKESKIQFGTKIALFREIGKKKLPVKVKFNV